MFVHAPHQVTCHTKVERSVPTAGEDVHVEWQFAPKVIPGRPSGTGPETMNTTLAAEKHQQMQICLKRVCMGSGLAAPLRPGMTSSLLAACAGTMGPNGRRSAPRGVEDRSERKACGR